MVVLLAVTPQIRAFASSEGVEEGWKKLESDTIDSRRRSTKTQRATNDDKSRLLRISPRELARDVYTKRRSRTNEMKKATIGRRRLVFQRDVVAIPSGKDDDDGSFAKKKEELFFIKTKKTKAEVVSARIRSVPLKKSADEKDAKVPVRAKILGSLGKRKKDTENSGSINEASKSGCTAYVVWKREKDCERAVKKGNMQKFNGHTLRVDFAAKSSQTTKGGKGDDGSGVTYDRTKSVFIGNLPFDVSDEEVIEIFTKNKEYKELKTELEAVRVVRDKATRTGKGIAFVLFKSVKAARTALLLDGFEMGKRELRVTKVGVVAPKRGNEVTKSRERGGKASNNFSKKDTKNGSHENNNNNANNNKRKMNSWEGGRSAKGNKAAKFEKKKSPTASALGDGKGKSAAFVGAKKKRASSSAGGKKRPAVALRKAKMKAGL